MAEEKKKSAAKKTVAKKATGVKKTSAAKKTTGTKKPTSTKTKAAVKKTAPKKIVKEEVKVTEPVVKKEEVKTEQVKLSNEGKKLITVGIILVGIIIAIIISSIMGSQNIDDSVKQYEELLNSEEPHLLYIGSAECSYCELFDPIFNEIVTDYDVNYSYVDTSLLNDAELNHVMDVFNTESSTPQVLVLQGGEIIDSQMGYVPRESFFSFLQDSEVINEEAELKDLYPSLNSVDYTEYEALINSGSDEVIMLSQTTCSYCGEAKPILNEIASEYDIVINYIELDQMSQEDGTKFMESLDRYAEDFGTPLTLVVNNKEVKDELSGLTTKEDYVTFFKDAGIIK